MSDEDQPEDTKPAQERLSKNINFIKYLIARAGVIIATQVLTVSVGWHVYATWGNVSDLGLIGLAQFLPFLALFLVAGLAADHFDRNRILSACSFVQAVTVAIIAIYFMTPDPQFWPVLCLLLLNSTARSFYHPASQATVPIVVPPEQFPQAMAVTSSVSKMGQLGGPAIGGISIALLGEGSYWLAAGIFVVSGVTALFVKLREDANTKPASTQPMAILDGFRYIFSHRVILGLISIDLVAVFFGGVMGLLPVYAIDVLRVGPEWMGILRATPAVGALLVALALARGRIAPPNGYTMFAALVVFGIAILVFSVSQWLWLSLVALAIYGAADMVSIYVRQILVQLETPNELRGRVSAVNSVSINASNELGDFRAGTMGGMIGAVPAVIVGGLATLAVAGIWWLIFPELRTAKPSYQPKHA